MTTAKKTTETAVVRKLTRNRRVASGDLTPDNSDKGFEDFAVQEKIAAARESKAVAVKDIIAHLSGKIPGRCHNPCKPSSMALRMMMR